MYLHKETDSYANPLKHISSYLAERLSQLQVVYADTLFTPNWNALVENRCPLCECKIYQMRNKPMSYCKSTSHKGFVIRNEVLSQLKYELTNRSTYANANLS